MNGKVIVLLVALMAVSCYSTPYKRVSNKKSCPCFKIYLPVCASNRESYDNLCEFQCAADHLLLTENIKLEIIKEDRCDSFDFSDGYGQ
ncbi:uncharacterized protein LOC121735508 [Aricia agestis]|uniref:uncharacterized protein LOC121735508 n=1 Tax=Aricia agestis TaxID=91739 RepID=UPI001C208AD4|nr:uncharacterized protein LOC121735508 [Aricia agestis]